MSVQLKTKIQPHRSSLYGVMECGVPLTPVMRNLLRAVTPVNHIAHFISSKMPGRRIGLLASPRTTNLYGQTGPLQRFSIGPSVEVPELVRTLSVVFVVVSIAHDR